MAVGLAELKVEMTAAYSAVYLVELLEQTMVEGWVEMLDS